MRCYLTVILICMSLMIRVVDYHLRHLLDNCIFFFFWKMSILILCLLFNQDFWFLFLVELGELHIWILTLYWTCHLQISSPIYLVVFLLLMVSFAVQKLFKLVCFVYFCFCFLAFEVKFTKIPPRPMFRSIVSMFSFMYFIVSGLTLNSLVHFELIFAYGVR